MDLTKRLDLGVSQGALPAVASRLAPIGRAIWNSAYLVFAGMFAFTAVTADGADTVIPSIGFALFSFFLWERDRAAQFWLKRSGEWRDLAERCHEACAQRDAKTLQWSDFRQRVADFMPADQGEAVLAALDSAIAPALHEVN